MAAATIIGSGPNGLAAAITLAQAGINVTVHEMSDGVGGSVRTLPLTLPGFHHDIGAAVLPLAIASPCFKAIPLSRHGLLWHSPEVCVAHPFDQGEAARLLPSLDETASYLGRDRDPWLRLFSPLCERWSDLLDDLLQPILRIPKHPALMTRFGSVALLSAVTAANRLFQEENTRALFLGCAAHSNLPLHTPGTAATALVLILAAHTGGWPIPHGGAQSFSNALAAHLASLGGEVVVNSAITSLPQTDLVLADTSPRGLASITGLKQSVQTYGPGIFKVDWALSAPIPWRSEICRQAGTIHLGGSAREIIAAEQAPSNSHLADRPFILLAQPSLFDSSRAPMGQHTAWAYCHVPSGTDQSALQQIEDQIERFAPDFRETVLARSTRTAQQMEAWNPNLIGGDLTGGAGTLMQTFFRTPYRTATPGVYLCSSSTAPGGGVHGMCGYNAALEALKFLRK